jgi:hypothetical protein
MWKSSPQTHEPSFFSEGYPVDPLAFSSHALSQEPTKRAAPPKVLRKRAWRAGAWTKTASAKGSRPSPLSVGVPPA